MSGLVNAGGNALVRLAEHARIVELPVCASCEKVAPKCECGHPTRNGKKED